MKNINLLPPEKKPTGAIVKLAKVLKDISTIALIVFIVAIGVVGALYFTMSSRIKKETANETDLKNEIKSLEQTEQQLVFIKDRLKKIDLLVKGQDTSEELTVLDQISRNLPSEVVIVGSELTPNETAVTVNTNSSANLGRFVDQLVTSSYSQVYLLDFSYDPETGYEVQFGVKI